jgi:hypothetical protein
MGKEGTIYLVDRDNMGHFSTNQNNIVQTQIKAVGGVWGSPAYFNHLIYFQGAGDVMKAFGITNGVMTSTPVTRSTTSFGGVGYTPSISANGTSNAIAWVIDTSAYTTNGPAVLHAYNATNLAQELYNSRQNAGRDSPGGAVKYAAPVVANGKVFVRGEYALSVYGLLPAPALSVSVSSNTVLLSWPTNTALAFNLQGTTDLLAGSWFSITNQVTATNGVFLVSIPVTGTAAFYRLKHH